ncbi:PaaX family transcriptional regulator [Streptomyces winkii]|uniref:PaaX family transcriptional regulator n=1 Tax=Streptomyces winkii TaxID=3051178 RepID=UPI0028D6B3C6|nr:PaaX family transcriptional regulator C-terminal domain-containing protein [Streptomyces sp. DSM 40971]
MAASGTTVESSPHPRQSWPASASARSLLLTVLGEFVLPSREPVWTGALLGALNSLGIEEKAARQALARSSSQGLLTSDRVGRRTRWSLTSSGEQLLEEGAERIYSFMRQKKRWDGRWLVLAVTVPETQRRLRHKLRTRLTWAGMGSPAPGLWVVPDAGRTDEVQAIVRELGIEHSTMSWSGPSAGIGDPQDVVAAAWPLEKIESAYGDFVRHFGDVQVSDQQGAFVAQVNLVHAWRAFPALDPALPAELLDHDWPGPDAATVFHRCHERWHRRAQTYWRRLCAGAGDRS